MTLHKVAVDFDDCLICGSNDVTIETASIEDNVFWDGDVATCNECGATGTFTVPADEEEPGYISWDEGE